MINRNVLILGMIGSGKTSLARHLIRRTPRAVILDRMYEYGEEGERFETFDNAVDYFIAKLETGEDFRLVFQSADERAFEAWFTLIFEAQADNPTPIGVFIEEASFYSDSHAVSPALLKLYTMGRHHRINLVSVAQRDTLVNPIVRANSHVVATLRQKTLSTDVKDRYTRSELETITRLQTLTPNDEPKNGVHFLTDQPDLDLFEYWSGAFDGATPEPAPEPVAPDPIDR